VDRTDYHRNKQTEQVIRGTIRNKKRPEERWNVQVIKGISWQNIWSNEQDEQTRLSEEKANRISDQGPGGQNR
jgi:hypothetical protein